MIAGGVALVDVVDVVPVVEFVGVVGVVTMDVVGVVDVPAQDASRRLAGLLEACLNVSVSLFH